MNAYKNQGEPAPSTWSGSGGINVAGHSTSATVTGNEAGDGNVHSVSLDYPELSDDEAITVVKVISIVAEPDVVCVGAEDVEYTITTEPAGHEDMVSYTPADTSTAGIKEVVATCGTSEAECTVTVVAVVSISAEPDVVCVGNASIEYTVTTEPAGHEDMVSYTPADTSTPGIKQVIATCGTSEAECTVTVVAVGMVLCGEVYSTTNEPGADETIEVTVGEEGATLTFTAMPEPDGQWPEGCPVWSGGATVPNENEPWTAELPIDQIGTYTVSASCCGSSVGIIVVVKESGGGGGGGGGGGDEAQVDLVFDGLPEETEEPPNEENPGGFLMLNDNDNAGGAEPGQGNGTPDLDDTPPLQFADSDLKSLTLSISPTPTNGTATLNIPACVRLWTDAKKTQQQTVLQWEFPGQTMPHTLYVEGYSPGAGYMTLTYSGGASASDTVKINLIKVDIVQSNVYACARGTNNVELNLTTDSWTNVIWAISPDLGTNGALFAAGPNGEGLTNHWQGVNVWLWPNNIPTNYNILASAIEQSDCFDTCIVSIFKVEFIHAEGEKEGEPMEYLPVFTPASGKNAGIPIEDIPDTDIELAFSIIPTTEQIDTASLKYLGLEYEVEETGLDTLLFSDTNDVIFIAIDEAPIGDTNVLERLSCTINCATLSVTNAVYQLEETSADSLVFINELAGLVMRLSDQNMAGLRTLDACIYDLFMRQWLLTETASNSMVFTGMTATVTMADDSEFTAEPDELLVAISDGYTFSNTVFRVQETGPETLAFRNFDEPILTSLPPLEVPEFSSWRIKIEGISDKQLISSVCVCTDFATNKIELFSVASLLSDEKFVLVPNWVEDAQVYDNYQTLMIDDEAIDWSDASRKDAWVDITLVAMANPVEAVKKKAEPAGMVLRCLWFIQKWGTDPGPIKQMFEDMGYVMDRNYNARKLDVLELIKGRQIWYSKTHGVPMDPLMKAYSPFSGLGFWNEDRSKGVELTASELLPLELRYKLAILDACISAHTSLDGEFDAGEKDTLLDKAQQMAEAFGPNVAYVGWGWEVQPEVATTCMRKFVEYLKYDSAISRARTVAEAHAKFRDTGELDIRMRKLLKIWGQVENVIDRKNP